MLYKVDKLRLKLSKLWENPLQRLHKMADTNWWHSHSTENWHGLDTHSDIHMTV